MLNVALLVFFKMFSSEIIFVIFGFCLNFFASYIPYGEFSVIEGTYGTAVGQQ